MIGECLPRRQANAESCDVKHKVMVLGCVGRMGSYLADEVKKAGFQVRSLIWDADRAANLPPDIDRVEGLLNDVSRLSLPLEEVEALEFGRAHV